jgi:hypothetical protein
MSLNLDQISLGTPPAGKDGDTQRTANDKTNRNMAAIAAAVNALADSSATQGAAIGVNAGAIAALQQTLTDTQKQFATLAQAYGNRAVNGGLEVWRSGTTFTVSPTLGAITYTADCFFASQLGVQSGCTVSRQIASGNGRSYYNLRTQRVAGSSGATVNITGHVIEFALMRHMWGGPVTVSFKAKCGADFSSAGKALRVDVVTGTVADQSAGALVNGTWTGYKVQASKSVALTNGDQLVSVTVPALDAGTGNIGVLMSYTATGIAGANDWWEFGEFDVRAASEPPKAFENMPVPLVELMATRYYRRYQGGAFSVAGLTNSVRVAFPGSIPMRVSPSMGNNLAGNYAAAPNANQWAVCASGVTYATITGGTIGNVGTAEVPAIGVFASFNIQTNELQMGANMYIEFSARL